MRICIEIWVACWVAFSGFVGIAVAALLVAWLWNRALDFSIKVFGETTRIWFDILIEMQDSGRARWNKGKPTNGKIGMKRELLSFAICVIGVLITSVLYHRGNIGFSGTFIGGVLTALTNDFYRTVSAREETP